MCGGGGGDFWTHTLVVLFTNSTFWLKYNALRVGNHNLALNDGTRCRMSILGNGNAAYFCRLFPPMIQMSKRIYHYIFYSTCCL